MGRKGSIRVCFGMLLSLSNTVDLFVYTMQIYGEGPECDVEVRWSRWV